jgi:hypothetical protein
VHFDHSISEWLQVIHGIAESTEDRAGTVLTSGNWGSRVNKDDLEVARSEIENGFGVELRADGEGRTNS